MHVILARNVNDAYRQGMALVNQFGIDLPSRNGPVKRVMDPVTTKYTRPTERVLFDAQRDANPFFHLFEALWMLSGANDVQALNHILPSFKQFSDDGETFHGAYGYRWRHWPDPGITYNKEIDQLALVIGQLRALSDSRRAIITMWNPVQDLNVMSKDLPCNDIIKVAIVTGYLDIQVYNRSNDIIYGCYGANAVHMSVLQEYLAAMIGVPVGRYFQISGDFHTYVETPYRWETYWPMMPDWAFEDPYQDNMHPVVSHPLVTFPDTFDYELTQFMECLRRDQSIMGLDPNFFRNSFFPRVAMPMHAAFEYHKAKDDMLALKIIQRTLSYLPHEKTDWLIAAERWIIRRMYKQELNTFPSHAAL